MDFAGQQANPSRRHGRRAHRLETIGHAIAGANSLGRDARHLVDEQAERGSLDAETGERLAKRDFSLTIRSLREAGKTPAEVREMAGFETP